MLVLGLPSHAWNHTGGGESVIAGLLYPYTTYSGITYST